MIANTTLIRSNAHLRTLKIILSVPTRIGGRLWQHIYQHSYKTESRVTKGKVYPKYEWNTMSSSLLGCMLMNEHIFLKLEYLLSQCPFWAAVTLHILLHWLQLYPNHIIWHASGSQQVTWVHGVHHVQIRAICSLLPTWVNQLEWKSSFQTKGFVSTCKLVAW